jgi:hypothetical protein
MKQTAVEWLEKEFVKLESTIGVHGVMYELIEQAKEMEKEQMCDFAEFVATYSDKNKNYLGDMLHAKSKYDGAERTIDLLEEYYNETFKQD